MANKATPIVHHNAYSTTPTRVLMNMIVAVRVLSMALTGESYIDGINNNMIIALTT